MTSQIPDTLIVAGEAYSLCVLPLNSLFACMYPRPRFRSTSTANRRGYRAVWKIEGEKLYLLSFSGVLDNEKNLPFFLSVEEPQFRYGSEEYKNFILQIEQMETNAKGQKISGEDWIGSCIPYENGFIPRSASFAIDMDKIFNSSLAPIFAEFYSGLLRCSSGQLLNYVQGGFNSEYERELIFHIESGRLIRRWEIDNRNGFNIRQAKEKIKKTCFSSIWKDLLDLATSGVVGSGKTRMPFTSDHRVPFEIEFQIARKISQESNIKTEGDAYDVSARYALDKALHRVSKARLAAISLFCIREKGAEIASMDPALYLQTIQFQLNDLNAAYETLSRLRLPYENLQNWAYLNMQQIEALIEKEEFEIIGFSRGIIEVLSSSFD